MLEIIRDHLQYDSDNDIQKNRHYFTLLATLHEMDTFDQLISQKLSELEYIGNPMMVARIMLRRLGFVGKVSEETPALQFTFSKGFETIASQQGRKQQTSGGIIFARGADDETLDCSSTLASMVMAASTDTESTFILTYVTKHRQYEDENLNTYPFPGTTPRESIKGTLTTNAEHELQVHVEENSPVALERLHAVLQKVYRSNKNISLPDITAAFLSHFFIQTATPEPEYFSQFYPPIHHFTSPLLSKKLSE